jgi:DNA polymerase elongation subunit (family B)
LGTRRRLFFDAETSPNIGFFWQAGYDLKVTHECIIEERALICVCWKWEGQDRVYSLEWDEDQCDRGLLEGFVPELLKADEAIAHNGDRFDIPWLRTRCLFYGIPFPPQIVTIDTLKAARGKFNFNSNKLDYIGKYLGLGGKAPTGGFQTWKDIKLKKCPKAMRRMVKYCKQDVRLLEEIFEKMNSYLPAKTSLDCEARNCPECGGRMRNDGSYYTAGGYKKVKLRCPSCPKYIAVAASRLGDYRGKA